MPKGGPKGGKKGDKPEPRGVKKRSWNFFGNFSAGTTLIKPVGYAIMLTSMIGNYSGLVESVYKACNMSAKPETRYTFPFLAAV